MMDTYTCTSPSCRVRSSGSSLGMRSWFLFSSKSSWRVQLSLCSWPFSRYSFAADAQCALHTWSNIFKAGSEVLTVDSDYSVFSGCSTRSGFKRICSDHLSQRHSEKDLGLVPIKITDLLIRLSSSHPTYRELALPYCEQEGPIYGIIEEKVYGLSPTKSWLFYKKSRVNLLASISAKLIHPTFCDKRAAAAKWILNTGETLISPYWLFRADTRCGKWWPLGNEHQLLPLITVWNSLPSICGYPRALAPAPPINITVSGKPTCKTSQFAQLDSRVESGIAGWNTIIPTNMNVLHSTDVR